MTESASKTFDIGKAFKDGMTLMGGALAVLAILYAFVSLANAQLPELKDQTGGEFLATMALHMVALYLSAAMYISIAAAQEGRALEVGQALSRAAKFIFPFLIAEIIVMGAIALGLVLFVIPGLIAVALFSFVFQVMIVEGLGPIQALSRSIELSENIRISLVFLFLAMILGMVVIFFLLGVVMALVVPAALIDIIVAGFEGAAYAYLAAVYMAAYRQAAPAVVVDEAVVA